MIVASFPGLMFRIPKLGSWSVEQPVTTSKLIPKQTALSKSLIVLDPFIAWAY